MKFREMSEEITSDEILIAFLIIEPEGRLKRYERNRDYIRVFYNMPNDNNSIEHRLDLLPDDVYYIDDEKDYIETPLENGDKMFQYHQFMVAKGYSYLWKNNPY